MEHQLSWVGEEGILGEEVLGTIVIAFLGILNPHYRYPTSPRGPIPGQQFLFLISVLTMPNFSSSPDFSSLRKWVTASVGFL